jgi:hypothetical protein
MIAALEGNTNPDAMVLLQMVKNGADLTKPHEPEFAFEALEKARATAIGNHLRSLGYDVSLYGPDEAGLSRCPQLLVDSGVFTWSRL